MENVFIVRYHSTHRGLVDVASYNTYKEARTCVEYLEDAYPGHSYRIWERKVYDKFDMLDADQLTEISIRLDDR